MKTIDYLHNLGLGSKNIVKTMEDLWQTVIEKLGLEELETVEWKHIHVGITGRDLKTKICNTVIFVIFGSKLSVKRNLSLLQTDIH